MWLVLWAAAGRQTRPDTPPTGFGNALILAYLMLSDPAFSGGGAAFRLPWTRLGAIILAAYVAAVLMTYLPARQAGRVPVAEALRFE